MRYVLHGVILLALLVVPSAWATKFQAAVAVTVLASGAKANTAAATSAWIDIRQYEGDLMFISNAGTVSAGTLTPTIEDATDGAGTGVATIAPNEGAFTVVTTSNDPLLEKRTLNSNHARGWVRYLGTIATGPVDLGVTLVAVPKNF